MRTRLSLTFLSLWFVTAALMQTAAAAAPERHTFYGEVTSVDLAAKRFTIKSGGRSFVFRYTEQTKLSSFHGYTRWDKIKPGEGATVMMRVGDHGEGVAVEVRLDAFGAARSKFLSLFVAKTTGGQTVSGVAVSNYVAHEPRGDRFSRASDIGAPGDGVFRAAVRADGTIGDVRLVKSMGNRELNERAMAWLKTWRFRPGTVAEVQMPISFSRIY